MSLFKREFDKEKSSLGFKSLRRVKKVSDHQVGKSVKSRDKPRKAMPPGKRISKMGRVYYETRKNRSDMPGTNL
jgi:hypothetical protein